MRLALVLVLAASIGITPRHAHADRGLEVMTMIGVGDERPIATIPGPGNDTHSRRGDTDDYDPYPARFLFQLTLGWEHDARSLPNLHPFNDGSGMLSSAYLSPELVLSALGPRALVQAGVRLEGASIFRDKKSGKRSESARMWIAPRIGWLEGAATPVIGFDYTTLLGGGGRWNFGLVMGANFWREHELVCRCLVQTKPINERPLTTYAEPYGGFSLSRRL